MKKAARILVTFSCIVMFIIIIPVILINSNIWDIAPPDTADLHVEFNKVANSDNAYTDLKAIANGLYFPEVMYEGMKIELEPIFKKVNGVYELEPHEKIDEYLAKNKHLIPRLRKILKQKKLQLPEVKTFQDSVDQSTYELYQIVDFLKFKIFYSIIYNDKKSMIELNNTALKLANCLMDSEHSSSIFFLTACSIIESSCLTTRASVANSTLSIKELENLLKLLPSDKQLSKLCDISYKGDFQLYCNEVDNLQNGKDRKIIGSEVNPFLESDLAEGLISASYLSLMRHAGKPKRHLINWAWNKPYYFQPNTLKLMLAERTRGLINNNKSNIKSAILSWGTSFKPNIFGEILFNSLLSSPDLSEAKNRTTSAIIGTRLLLYCKIHEIKYGELPDSLNQLIPEFISTIPTDPFDGKPFRYVKARKLVYSVGKNKIDSLSLDEQENKKTNNLSREELEQVEDLVYSLNIKVTRGKAHN